MTTTNNDVKQGIEQLVERFMAAWNRHDASAFAQVFAEDADFTNVFGQTFHGRVAIEAQHAPILNTMFKNSQLAPIGTNIRFIGEHVAALDVLWNMHGATDRQEKPWPDRKGLMNLIVTNENGNWAILVMHNMDLVQPA